MDLNAYLPVLVQILIAVGIAVSILVASSLLGQRAKSNSIKDKPYECGVLPETQKKARFSVKFYVVAMLFIVFDIELVFLIPWVLVYREYLAIGIPILLPVLFFLTVIAVSLIYEIKKGGLEWKND